MAKKNKILLDENDKPLAINIAKTILEETPIITLTDNEEMLYFNNGIYHKGARSLIKKKAQELVPFINKHYKDEVVESIKGLTYLDRKKINLKNECISLKNGLYNLKEDTLFNKNPDDYLTYELPIHYDPKADCPKIKKFLKEVLHETDIPIIQELIGYCLLKEYPIQKAIMFLGEGSNGKSVLLSLIKTFLGSENISSIPLQALDDNRFAAAQLYGKLANIYADISTKALYQTGVFKMLTGGDMISAEQKFQKHFNFINYAKLMFSCNQLPETKDESLAYFRRWIIIEFPNKFEGRKADKNLIKKLTTEDELSGLFNWALIGLKRLIKQGEFTHSPAMDEMEKIYKMKSSPLSAFVMEKVKVEEDSHISKDDFYQTYRSFCEDNSLEIVEKNVVGRKLPVLIPKVMSERIRINGKLTYCWKNITIDDNQQNLIDASSDSSKNQDRKSCSRCSMQKPTLSLLDVHSNNKIENYIEQIEQNNPFNIVKQALGEEFTEDMLLFYVTDELEKSEEYAKKVKDFWLEKGIIFEFKKGRFKWVD